MSRAARICLDPRLAAGLCLLLMAWLPAAGRGDRPEGLPVGPWILSPWLKSSYDFESNVLLDDDDDDADDTITRLDGGIGALLPFRNSELELNYRTSSLNYAEKEFQRDSSQTAEVRLELQFRHGDKLTLRDVYRRDFARARNPASEGAESFVGEPYNVNRWEVELRRNEPLQPGYLLRVRRIDFIYDGETDIGFFDYRGFEYQAEYHHPLPSRRQLVVAYHPRRFDHYDPSPSPGSEFQVGVPFREATTDELPLGFSGMLGEDQPYLLQLGYGRSVYDDFEDDEESEFTGLVGSASWDLRIGGRSGVDLTAFRRSLPSNFSSYYINTGLRADFHRQWLDFESGFELDWTVNDYGDPELCGLDPVPFKREDKTLGAELYWDWKVHQRFRFEVSSFYENRNSNCEISDYDAVGVSAGVRLGWF